MKKIGLVAAVVLFVLFISSGIAWGNDQMSGLIQKTIKEGLKLCDILKEENVIIMRVLDFIMVPFNDNPPVYAEMEKFKVLTQKAERLVLESQKLLRGISEKDEEIVRRKLSQFRINVEKANVIHKTVFSFFQIILYPLLEKQKGIIV